MNLTLTKGMIYWGWWWTGDFKADISGDFSLFI